MIFFSAMVQLPHKPPHRRVTHRRAREMLQIAPPLSCGRRWAIREVCRKQLLLHLADLPGSSQRLLRSQRVSLALHPGEAFDRGEAHPEEAGGFALGCSSLEGVDYLLSEVFRVGFHACMISHGSRFLLTAVMGRSDDPSCFSGHYRFLANGDTRHTGSGERREKTRRMVKVWAREVAGPEGWLI